MNLMTNLSSSKANTSIARWYAIQVASSCEKKVKATLEQRSVTLGVNNRIIEIEIPQTPGIKLKKDGSRQTTEEKVFPGYVLVLSLIHISEPTRRTPISYAVFCTDKVNYIWSTFYSHHCIFI